MKPSQRISGRNGKEVYEAIRRRGAISKMDLKQLSGLTTSTLTRLLDELLAQGLIAEVGFGESTGGRRPILYRTNPAYACVFGWDISRTSSKLVLCDMHLNKMDAHAWKMDDAMTPERLIGEMVDQVRHMLDKHRIPASSVLGMGIGAVGPLDRSSGTILNPQNFPSAGWKDVDICRIAEERLGFYVALDNGANTAVLGEHWASGVDSVEHLLYVHAGVGIRSAMIAGGQIVYGAIDMEGAVGQMIIQADGPSPRDASGNYGGWESFVSTYAIEEAARSSLKKGRNSALLRYAERPERIKYPMVEQAAREGDPLAVETLTQAACYFGIGLANLLNILHPQKVVLGGPLILGNELFYEQAIEVALNKTYHAPVYQVAFEKSRLGEDAVSIGAAAKMIMELTE